MKSKTIVILGAGSEQTIAIRQAQEMGLRVIACDGNKNAQGLNIADIGIHVDITDVEKIYDKISKYEIDGIMTHAVEIPDVVANLAEMFDVPGLDPKVAKVSKHKDLRIQRLKEHGISCADFRIISSIEEAEEAVLELGLPCVVKPVDNAGARGVKLITDIEGLENAYSEAKKYSRSSNPNLLLEEYLTGQQISTESVIYEGEIYTTGYGYRNYSDLEEYLPYFVENGIDVPSKEFGPEREAVLDTVERAINALGIDWGVAKGDILVDQHGEVYVIEMASRSSGGWFATGTQPLATGVDIIPILIKMSLGETCDESEFDPKFYRASSQRYLIPNKNGIFKGISGIDRIKESPLLKDLEVFHSYSEGDEIKKATNHAERLAMVITDGENLADAKENMHQLLDQIQINIE